MYDLFVRRGAQLGDEEKRQLSTINQELASLYASFRQKLLADEETWTALKNDADSRVLSPALIDSAKAAAAERTLPGKGVIVNTRSSVDPFLTFSSRRDLRERVWKKFKNRGDNGDQNDTKQPSPAS
jgi:peptidyl-dipeptidase Dcp